MSMIIQESINYANSQMNTAWSKRRWANSPYLHVKEASPTEKGDWGENLTSMLLTHLGYPTDIVNGGIGDYDLLHDDIRIEHKLATLDCMDHFQFNGIDKDKDFDILWCLGVAPNALYLKVAEHGWVSNNLTTNMSKAGGGYKWAVRQDDMWRLTEKQVDALLKSMIRRKAANYA